MASSSTFPVPLFGLLLPALVLGSCALSREGTKSSAAGGGTTTTSTTTSTSSTTSTSTSTTTSTTTNTSSGGTGGAGAGGGGTGGCLPTEDCLNSVDDDCDGDIDCDDSDCNAYGCLTPPPGGVFAAVALGPGLCGLALETLLKGCADCACEVDDSGSCGHAIELYDNSGCSGSAVATELVVGSGCTTIQATAVASDTVAAIAHATGLGDAQCSPAQLTAGAGTRTLCTSGGSCSGGGTCVPAGQSLPCVLLDGDVDCPDLGDTRTVLFSGGSDTCDCDCLGGRQFCPTDEHFHAYENASCGGAKTDVDGDGACVDTGQPTVLSVNNHTGDISADSAKCVDGSKPQGSPTAMTLCCP